MDPHICSASHLHMGLCSFFGVQCTHHLSSPCFSSEQLLRHWYILNVTVSLTVLHPRPSRKSLNSQSLNVKICEAFSTILIEKCWILKMSSCTHLANIPFHSKSNFSTWYFVEWLHQMMDFSLQIQAAFLSVLGEYLKLPNCLIAVTQSPLM